MRTKKITFHLIITLILVTYIILSDNYIIQAEKIGQSTFQITSYLMKNVLIYIVFGLLLDLDKVISMIMGKSNFKWDRMKFAFSVIPLFIIVIHMILNFSSTKNGFIVFPIALGYMLISSFEKIPTESINSNIVN